MTSVPTVSGLDEKRAATKVAALDVRSLPLAVEAALGQAWMGHRRARNSYKESHLVLRFRA